MKIDRNETNRLKLIGVAGACIGWALSCINTSSPAVPPLLLTMNDTAVSINDTVVLHVKAADADREPLRYLWSFDEGATFPDTTDSAWNVVVWGEADTGNKLVIVKAVKNSGLESSPESIDVEVLLNAPHMASLKDTTIFINDTMTFFARAEDPNGRITRYIWAVDSSDFTDTTLKGAKVFSWVYAQEGLRSVRVKALDDDGLESNIATSLVTVRKGIPSVRAMNDTTVSVNDTVVFCVEGSDTNGAVLSFAWSFDGAAYDLVTDSGGPFPIWIQENEGPCTVWVKGIDDDGVESAPDSFIIRVLLNAPVVAAIPDTVVYRDDTVRISLTASDTNGTIEEYYWDENGDGWDDTTLEPVKDIFYYGSDTCVWIAGARDDDGLVTADTFIIVFTPLPFVPFMAYPADSSVEFFRTFDSTLKERKLVFSFGVQDLDGVPDTTISYILRLRPENGENELVYTGTDTSFTVVGLDTVPYLWQLTAADSNGYSIAVNGSFRCLWQRAMDFIGHSIITGMGSFEGTGGFRMEVLETFREKCGHPDAVKAVGPLVTGLFSKSPRDDSCLAVAGKTSYHIYDSLRLYPDLNADIWVMMLGVNGNFYDFLERFYIVALMEAIHARNRDCEMYVLNGIPVPDSVDPVYSDSAVAVFQQRVLEFNSYLEEKAEERRANGWKIQIVDAFSALSEDSAWVLEYYYDPIHPNEKGYELLAREILKTMGLSPSSPAKRKRSVGVNAAP
jgi:hypothetical protein